MKVVPLGAGQDVGRSCVIVTLGRKNIMFDCGMHMGYHDERKFPDFSFISKTGQFTQAIDCVIISHFHLDHCGALPYFTEVCGYDGPIIMTYPTKAIAPILLEDLRRVNDRKGDDGKQFFSAQDIANCMKKTRAMNLHQTIMLDNELEIRPYYAGHVLGAAMFYVKDHVSGCSVMYTGDYNMTPDRHLGRAASEKLRPNLLITETTYATTIRDSKSVREREFLKEVHTCVDRGGKVLVPVFALGRVQELCILIETYWERMNLGHVPIYFSAGLVQRANYYYQLFINWTNEKIKETFVERNMFDFNHIKEFDRNLIDKPGPMVLFATPGMLHAGMSLEVWKRWAPDERNMVILPGYCVEGTVGNKVLTSKTGKIEIDSGKTVIDMKCDVRSISFSAHADAKGILQLIKDVEPKNVMLVHGEKGKMEFFKKKIEKDYKIKCYDPPNGCTVEIQVDPVVNVNVSKNLLKRSFQQIDQDGDQDVVGILVSKNDGEAPLLMQPSEAARELGLKCHGMSFSTTRDLPTQFYHSQDVLMQRISDTLNKNFETCRFELQNGNVVSDTSVVVHCGIKMRIVWSLRDELLGEKVLLTVDDLLNTMVVSHQEDVEMSK
ncbi:hypothetical protein AKO1_014007 [Acrasis kona]|uniref:Integrator complex subunit 11 n=1 Tax=Acrasis kona TaxID=1008807 RepID=A0AAW2Z4Z5_9EUKA